MLGLAVYAQIRDWSDLPGCLIDDVPTLKCFEVVAGNILTVASALIVLVLFVMFVVGAFNYLTSLGNPERVKKAQSTLKYAVMMFCFWAAREAYLILKLEDSEKFTSSVPE